LIDKNANELYTFAFDIIESSKLKTKKTEYVNEINPVISRRKSEMMKAYGMTTKDQIIIKKSQEKYANAKRKSNTAIHANTIKLPMGSGICGYVAQTHKGLNIKDIYLDPRY
jgi:hypothetical protein